VSNYVKSTDFAVKDGLLSGNPAKIIKGTEIDDEFNNIATAVQTKADLASPTFTGTPLAPTAAGGTNTTQIATTAFVTSAVSTERTATATLTNKTLTSPLVNELLFEGTADDYETTIAFTDPTADRTITFPDKGGTVAMTSDVPSAATVTSFSGTYSISGTTATITSTAHGRAINEEVYLNFTSGTGVDGNYTIATVPDVDTFTVTHASATTSGNVSGYYSTLGTVKLASTDEAIVATSTTKAVTPSALLSVIDGRFVRETEKATTSGTTIEFTGIPSWAKRITIIFNAVTNDGSALLVQVGSSTGYDTSGYTSASSDDAGTATSTAGFVLRSTDADSDLISGSMVLHNVSGTTWISSHSAMAANNNKGITGGGRRVMTTTLDRVRLNTASGTTAFDGGAVNIMYE